MIKIMPSMLAANHGYIQEEVKRVGKWGVDALHLDIMELDAVSDIGFLPHDRSYPLIHTASFRLSHDAM